MIEVTGDLWTYPAQIRCITTNGFVKANGRAVMGRGCAAEAAKRWPQLPKLLAAHIKNNGNHAGWLFGDNHNADSPVILSFPVKHNWWEKADIELIKRSAKEVRVWAGEHPKIIVIPRPGCGNGKLLWEDVREVLAPILDDRFHIITKA